MSAGGGGGRARARTFFSTRECVLGWTSVVLFVAIFPVFVTWLFVSPRHGLGASWKPAAMSAATVVLLSTGAGFGVCGSAYSGIRGRSRRVLAERGYLSCPYCPYDLRGVALPGVCPECGEAVGDSEGVREHWRRQYGAGGPVLGDAGPEALRRSG